MLEAVRIPETSVYSEIARLYIPKALNLYTLNFLIGAVSFTLWPLHPVEIASSTHWIGVLVGSALRLQKMVDRKVSP
jgi:hypothetical protein